MRWVVEAAGREWTLAEANAALPRVREALRQARKVAGDLRAAEEQLQDLRTMWGDQVLAVACPDHAEWLRWRAERARLRDEAEVALLRFTQLGCEAKDLDMGLVDFRGRLGDQEVYLCWRDGEASVGHYHPLEGGFASRRAIPGTVTPQA